MKPATTFCNEMSENLDFLNSLIQELNNPEFSKGKTETSILSELMIVLDETYNFVADRRDSITNNN